jgi:hypothetical protein
MSIQHHKYILFTFALFSLLATSCRKDTPPPTEQVTTLFTPNPASVVKGVYLLNEGNFNTNKATLDYVDYTTGQFRKNIYNQVNPEVTKGLGDVGNDMAVYGSKLYVVVNNSNKIEVLNAKNGKRITQIDLLNCRYIAFRQNKAYVSAYLSTIANANAPNGMVAEIDTASLQIERRVTVGRQPEEMAVINNNLYVANSGGYSPSNYERTVSVVDLSTFTETKRIDVAINLSQIKADRYGDLYVTSRGDYLTVPPKLYVVNAQSGQIKKVFDIPARTIALDDDQLFIISTNSGNVQQKYTYQTLNVTTETLLGQPFITDGTDLTVIQPYGLAINPATKEILLTDARDYVTPGTLYCFDATGKKKWQVTTGDVPAHFAFIY